MQTLWKSKKQLWKQNNAIDVFEDSMMENSFDWLIGF
jgi:hypothetical protein